MGAVYVAAGVLCMGYKVGGTCALAVWHLWGSGWELVRLWPLGFL